MTEYTGDLWNLDQAKAAPQQLFDIRNENKPPKPGQSNRASLTSAFKHGSWPVNLPYKTIKAYQMQETIDGCGKGYGTQPLLKTFGAILTGSP